MLSPLQIINQAAISRSNEERLAIWKQRYQAATGIKPTDVPYKVKHCRTCKRPHWYSCHTTGEHITARCAGH